ncbi:MAG: pyruvate kinase [Chloroflexi bacterium]|nr:pyruvate kinase [Chloroflexota bacterium]
MDLPRTKIHATLGPASRSPRVLAGLVAAGVSAFRLNLSHALASETREVAQAIRAEAAAQGRPVAILADLRGRKLRLGRLLGHQTMLRPGQPFVLAPGQHPGTDEGAAVDCPSLAGLGTPGAPVLLDDGALRLRIERTDAAGHLHCTVEVGGELLEGCGVTFPHVALPLPALTPKDLSDLDAVLAAGVDFLYFSYVQSADDIHTLRRELARRGAHLPIVAKVERQVAIAHLDEIVAAADGICVARGDLGVEVPWGRLPHVQEQAVAVARAAGAMVVLGGEVLQSMTQHSRPFRAEATDLAVAVRQGVDAIVLSDETAIGADPIRAVQTLARLLEENEAVLGWPCAEGAPVQTVCSVEEALQASQARGPERIVLDLPPAQQPLTPWLVNWWGISAC